MIVDANILIYAADVSSRHHEPAKAWLQDALNGPVRTGLPWLSLTAFLRIGTDRSLAGNPHSQAEAWAYVEQWLATRSAWIPGPTDRHGEVLGQLLAEGDIRGPLVTDAHLAAMAIEHGVGVCSADSDFARFTTFVPWFNPITSGTSRARGGRTGRRQADNDGGADTTR